MKPKVLLRSLIFLLAALILSYGALFLANIFAFIYGGIPFLGGGSKSFLDLALVTVLIAVSYIGPSILAFFLYKSLRTQKTNKYLIISILLVIVSVPLWILPGFTLFDTFKSNIRKITNQMNICKNRNGINVHIDERTKEKQIVECKNGIFQGSYQDFYSNGTAKTKTFYVNGSQKGEYISFYPNGTISSYTTQLEDMNKKKGLEVNVSQDGFIESVYRFPTPADGKSNYDYVTVYIRPNFDTYGLYDENSQKILCNRNNIKMVTFTCKNGQFDGSYKEYRSVSGKDVLYREAVYKDGKLDGEYKEYDFYGNYIKYKANYNNDKLNGEFAEYLSNGEVVNKYDFKNGNPLLDQLRDIPYFQYIFN